MASLLPTNGIFLDVSGQAPAPSKDFHQFVVTKDFTIWRSWRISLRNDYKRLQPSESKEPLEDFQHDERLQFDVRRVFGDSVCDYAINISKGIYDFISYMPKPLLIYIASFLDLEDIAQLSQTSKLMYEVCSAQALWEQIYHTHCDTVTDEMISLADDLGWKQMFFTNKLQLQVKLRRHQRQRSSPEVNLKECGSGDRSTTFLTEDET